MYKSLYGRVLQEYPLPITGSITCSSTFVDWQMSHYYRSVYTAESTNGKIKRFVCSDLLPEPAARDTRRWSRKKPKILYWSSLFHEDGCILASFVLRSYGPKLSHLDQFQQMFNITLHFSAISRKVGKMCTQQSRRVI